MLIFRVTKCNEKASVNRNVFRNLEIRRCFAAILHTRCFNGKYQLGKILLITNVSRARTQ